jgi:hypothetical protein
VLVFSADTDLAFSPAVLRCKAHVVVSARQHDLAPPPTQPPTVTHHLLPCPPTLDDRSCPAVACLLPWFVCCTGSGCSSGASANHRPDLQRISGTPFRCSSRSWLLLDSCTSTSCWPFFHCVETTLRRSGDCMGLVSPHAFAKLPVSESLYRYQQPLPHLYLGLTTYHWPLLGCVCVRCSSGMSVGLVSTLSPWPLHPLHHSTHTRCVCEQGTPDLKAYATHVVHAVLQRTTAAGNLKFTPATPCSEATLASRVAKIMTERVAPSGLLQSGFARRSCVGSAPAKAVESVLSEADFERAWDLDALNFPSLPSVGHAQADRVTNRLHASTVHQVRTQHQRQACRHLPPPSLPPPFPVAGTAQNVLVHHDRRFGWITSASSGQGKLRPAERPRRACRPWGNKSLNNSGLERQGRAPLPVEQWKRVLPACLVERAWNPRRGHRVRSATRATHGIVEARSGLRCVRKGCSPLPRPLLPAPCCRVCNAVRVLQLVLTQPHCCSCTGVLVT